MTLVKIIRNGLDLFAEFRNSAYSDNFSLDALSEIAEHYADIGKRVEFDAMTLCNDWTEYPPAEFLKQWGDDDDDSIDATIERLESERTIFHLENGNVVVSED